MASQFYNGKRLSYDGQLCTVRYYGEVKGTKGEWLGVEWDDPFRGKHSGEHGGIRYFECLSEHPTAGSFVRPTRKNDPPREFVDALKAKYASEDFEDPDVKVVFQIRRPSIQRVKPIRISGKEVEEVGFDKIRKQLADLKELKIVILDGLCMWRPIATLKARKDEGKEGEEWPADLTDVQNACPKTIELDLSRNLFEEWREIASICEQLTKLKSLRADGNRFRDTSITDSERQRCIKAFQNIKTLKLEETLLSWEAITNITALFAQLTTFVASSNAYTTLTDHYLTPTVTDLTLEDNKFSSLSALVQLTNLPSLQRLVLKSNKISDISLSSTGHPVFAPTVTEVDLSFNEISTWSFIDQLPKVFPGLTSLRVSHNPLYSSLQAPDGRALTAEDGYMLTIARLGNLKILNYSPITEKERLNAESYYLSLIAREVIFSPPHLQEQILFSHPRYRELCDEYGEPNIQRSPNAINPNSLAARLIRLKCHLGDTATSNGQNNVFEAEIPLSCTAYTLLGIVGKHYGIPPMKCRLVWETGDWMPAPRAAHDADDQDSTDSEGDDGGEEKARGDSVMREVEILAGTRAVGTWIDGREAVVRVERK